MLVTEDLLQDLMVAALTGKTGIGANWFTPRTWPTTPDEMPIGFVQSPKSHKQGMGRSGAPQFTVLGTFRVVARVSGKATDRDAAAAALLGALGVLQRQIEIALVNDYELRRHIQEFASIEVTNGVSREGEQPVGELVMDFGLEFYQGPEDFAPNPSTPLEQLAVYADLVNVFSPTGAFDDTPFADQATASPRTSGPDGRPEGALLIDLPQ